jgi:hypothetical protein
MSRSNLCLGVVIERTRQSLLDFNQMGNTSFSLFSSTFGTSFVYTSRLKEWKRTMEIRAPTLYHYLQYGKRDSDVSRFLILRNIVRMADFITYSILRNTFRMTYFIACSWSVISQLDEVHPLHLKTFETTRQNSQFYHASQSHISARLIVQTRWFQ